MHLCVRKFFKLIRQKICKMSCPRTSCQDSAHKVYMVRHGQSEWNRTNQFTGWCDVPLSERGRADAVRNGQIFLKHGIKFDLVFTSVLERCIESTEIILRESQQPNVPVVKHWRLNERHYGALTGLNKVMIKKKFGEELVKQWRRGYDYPPPDLQENNPYYTEILNCPAYKDGPPKSEMPLTESLKDTVFRVVPYWENTIAPEIRKGLTVLICAHGNSLRGLMKMLDEMTDEEIVKIDVPNALPYYYILNKNLKVTCNGSMIFLDNPEDVKKAYNFLYKQSEKPVI